MYVTLNGGSDELIEIPEDADVGKLILETYKQLHQNRLPSKAWYNNEVVSSRIKVRDIVGGQFGSNQPMSVVICSNGQAAQYLPGMC